MYCVSKTLIPFVMYWALQKIIDTISKSNNLISDFSCTWRNISKFSVECLNAFSFLENPIYTSEKQQKNTEFLIVSSRTAKYKTPPKECPRYDAKQSDGEVPVMLELWGMQSTPSLPLLPGQFKPVVATPDRVLSMGQKELNCVLMLNWIVSNRTVFDI